MDPFSGSGTTACAAVLEGCNYIAFEMDPNWQEKGAARVAAEQAKVQQEEDWMK